MNLPEQSYALRLARITRKEELILCEAVAFKDGRAAIDTILRRAAISGRTEIEGRVQNHFADVLDQNGDLLATVALDANSYRALKTHWMRCKVDRQSEGLEA